MAYRVLWSPNAEQELEKLALISPQPELLASAAREIDKSLIHSPQSFGESRFDSVRVGFVRPLGIQFEVLDDVRTVIVYDVWRIDRS